MERKSRQYIDLSDGKIRVALIIDIQYPGMKKAWVSLLAADNSSSSWVQRSDLFYDDDLGQQQPAGHVALYLSDFVGLAPGLPVAVCRPSSAEVAAGITRFVAFFVSGKRNRSNHFNIGTPRSLSHMRNLGPSSVGLAMHTARMSSQRRMATRRKTYTRYSTKH